MDFWIICITDHSHRFKMTTKCEGILLYMSSESENNLNNFEKINKEFFSIVMLLDSEKFIINFLTTERTLTLIVQINFLKFYFVFHV